MKRKALLLLTLFLLHTVAGVACALHMAAYKTPAGSGHHERGLVHSCHTMSISKEKPLKAVSCCQDETNATVKSISYTGNAELKVHVCELLPAFFLSYLQVIETPPVITGYVSATKPPPSVDIRVVINSFLI